VGADGKPLIAAGQTVPDVSGQYSVAGQHGGQPYWRLGATDWVLWYCDYEDFLGWYVSDIAEMLTGVPDVLNGTVWEGPYSTPAGEYQPRGQALGTLTLSEL